MSGDHLLAIDHGTQSVRALLFDPAGNLVARARVPIEPYVSPHPGWAEQDPELYWRAVCEACRALVAEPAVQRRRDRRAGADDPARHRRRRRRDGRPLRPAIVWLDQRRTDGLPPVGGLWGLAFRLVGVPETVAYFQAEAEANWLIANEPEIWAQTRQYLLLSGFLAHRLTGRFVDRAAARSATSRSTTSASGGPGRDWKWQAVPDRAASMLPELVPPAAARRAHGAPRPKRPACPPASR